MKRYFINQEDASNKFWKIETTGKTQTVIFGKVGTAGRQAVKEFGSEAECLKESEKLIAQKIKKGYVEIPEGEAIPEKVNLPQEELEEKAFWDAIKKSNKVGNKDWQKYDVDEHLENLTELLSKWGKPKLIAFERVLQQSLQQLYKAHIAELQFILEDDFKKEDDKIIFDEYLSTDGFIYFRCWLVLKGKQFFDEIRHDINAFINGKYSFDIGDTWGEGLLYVADEAYSVNHDNEDESEIRDAVDKQFPDLHYDSGKNQFDREPKGGAFLQKMYPELVTQMVAIR